MNHEKEFIRGALAALHEAKTMGLAHATLAGVLSGPVVAEALIASSNALLDPLIDKYNEEAKK
ncbi:hypothetical protein [Cedecea davisae]|uniref:hypothetical protein n=1 Tax=Cedecea davisae TaxID=158484 RepID=UPI002431C37A|nr:hypothetical protein [Cedecea davisae]